MNKPRLEHRRLLHHLLVNTAHCKHQPGKHGELPFPSSLKAPSELAYLGAFYQKTFSILRYSLRRNGSFRQSLGLCKYTVRPCFTSSVLYFPRIPDPVRGLAAPPRPLAQPDRGRRHQNHDSPQTVALRALHFQSSGTQRCGLQPAQFTLQDVQDRGSWYESSISWF